MGEVYRARDTRLDREVAIKVLPAGPARRDALERLQQEARLIGALNHPHICTLHDIGEHRGPEDGSPTVYLVLELLEGATLYESRSRIIPAADVIRLGIQLADALEAAHGRGIVHRDLKPANIFLTRRGDVKILDFGVARRLESLAEAETRTLEGPRTGEGVTIGTLAYMAPEQLRCEPLDGRADLFSLGLVLYEMVTGKQAFARRTTAVTIDAVLNVAPVPPRTLNGAVPERLEQIVLKLLEKDRTLRYQHASELGADLKRLQRDLDSGLHPATTDRRPRDTSSVAVLPFRNMSSDPESQFFSDGLAEDLTGALTRISGLRVASLSSAFRFRGPDVDTAAVGAALKVAAVVVGSVRRSGKRLRISAQLVNVGDGYQMWSDRYDREMADVFDIQDEIVEALVQALAPALLREAKEVVRRPTDNLEAYELYLKGRHYWHQRSPATVTLAIQYFNRAIALDENFALAYSGLSDSWGIYRPYGWLSADACRPQARAAIERAIALAPDLAEVQFSMGLHIYYFEREWRNAEPHLRRAIELNPQWSWPHIYLGMFLTSASRLEEAIPYLEMAMELDPLSPFVHGLACLTYTVGGRIDTALQLAETVVALQPDYLLGLWTRALALDTAGEAAQAAEVLERVVAQSRAAVFIGMLGRAYGGQGRIDECERLLAELDERETRGEYIAPVSRLLIAIGRNDLPGIRRWLQACVDDETSWFTLSVAPGGALDRFRGDPIVAGLIDQVEGRAPAPGSN
jgi:serine/threonine protein kinase/tetratricopeptide (TPR) repeat protein